VERRSGLRQGRAISGGPDSGRSEVKFCAWMGPGARGPCSADPFAARPKIEVDRSEIGAATPRNGKPPGSKMSS